MYVQFEVWQLNLTSTQKVLSMAIEMCPKEALFQGLHPAGIQCTESLSAGSSHDVDPPAFLLAPRIWPCSNPLWEVHQGAPPLILLLSSLPFHVYWHPYPFPVAQFYKLHSMNQICGAQDAVCGLQSCKGYFQAWCLSNPTLYAQASQEGLHRFRGQGG